MTKVDYSFLKTDIHSHILPAIDDGSKTFEDAKKFVLGLLDVGYSKIISTPHSYEKLFENTSDNISQREKEFKEFLKKNNVEVEFSSAAEYHLDARFEKMLHNNEPLRCLKNNLVLVEFEISKESYLFTHIPKQLVEMGYQPVIAHPERYYYLINNKKFYDEWKELGCMFQLNILSPTGIYSQVIKELTTYLTQKKYYDFVGTDLHNINHLKHIQTTEVCSLIKQVFDTCNIQNSSL